MFEVYLKKVKDKGKEDEERTEERVIEDGWMDGMEKC